MKLILCALLLMGSARAADAPRVRFNRNVRLFHCRRDVSFARDNFSGFHGSIPS